MKINIDNLSNKTLGRYGAIFSVISGGCYIISAAANKKVNDLLASIDAGSPLEQSIEASIQTAQNTSEGFLIPAYIAGALALANFAAIGIKYFKNKYSRNVD